jgi:hypothetical protein
MAETIRDQIFSNFQAKLQTMRTANGYNLELGDEVYFAFLPPVDFEILPAIGFLPTIEEATNLHGYHQKFDMQVQVQAVAKVGTIKAGTMAEMIYADIIEAVSGNVWTLGFDSGGPFKATIGATITGADSGATGYICGVSLDSGAWADEDAAGALELRRVEGEFNDDEKIDIESNDDVATVDGVQSAQGALETTTGNLADAIDILSARPQYPNAEQQSAGVEVVFSINYKRVTGNPYSQTN